MSDGPRVKMAFVRFFLLYGLLQAGGALAAAGATPYIFDTNETTPYTFGSVTVKVESSINGTEGGMAWARCSVSNSGVRARKVMVTYHDHIEAKVSFEIGPQETHPFTVPLPPVLSSGRVEIDVDGEHQWAGFYVGRYTEPRTVSVGPEAAHVQTVGYSPVDVTASNAATPALRVSLAVPEHLPDQLAAYAGMDSILFTGTSVDQLDDIRLRVLEAYVATGGRLAITQCSAATRSHFPLFEKAPRPGLNAYGFGSILWCGAKKEEIADFVAQRAPAVSTTLRRGPVMSGHEGYELLLPEATPPVARFYLIMVLFGVAVGPGSYWVARSRGSALLLVTIPGTSLLTCLVVIGWALIGDGLRTRASTRSLTLIDSANGRVITVGMGAFFAGMTPPELPLSNTEAWSGQPASITLNPHLVMDRGFIPARTYVEWGMASVVPSRIRLGLKGQKVVNGLGAKAHDVFVVRDGKLWVARELENGGEATLEPASGTPPLGGLIRPPVNTQWEHLSNHYRSVASAPLAEGEFVAWLDGPGSLPLGPLPVDHHESRYLVRGEVTQ